MEAVDYEKENVLNGEVPPRKMRKLLCKSTGATAATVLTLPGVARRSPSQVPCKGCTPPMRWSATSVDEPRVLDEMDPFCLLKEHGTPPHRNKLDLVRHDSDTKPVKRRTVNILGRGPRELNITSAQKDGFVKCENGVKAELFVKEEQNSPQAQVKFEHGVKAEPLVKEEPSEPTQRKKSVGKQHTPKHNVPCSYGLCTFTATPVILDDQTPVCDAHACELKNAMSACSKMKKSVWYKKNPVRMPAKKDYIRCMELRRRSANPNVLRSWVEVFKMWRDEKEEEAGEAEE